jgi:hypothetical protein
VGDRRVQGVRAAGLLTAYVSNGNGTPRVSSIRPWGFTKSSKSFDDRHYRELGDGRADPRHHPPPARDGHLGRNRHVADLGLTTRAMN